MITVTTYKKCCLFVPVQSPVTYREATALLPRIEHELKRHPITMALVDTRYARVYSHDVRDKCMTAVEHLVRYVGKEPDRQLVILVNPTLSLGGEIWARNRDGWALYFTEETVLVRAWDSRTNQEFDELVPLRPAYAEAYPWLRTQHLLLRDMPPVRRPVALTSA